MQFLSRPGARALVAIACLAGLVTPAHAQQAPAAPLPTPRAPAQSPAALPSGPERPLSINEAVDLALKQNLGIQIERLNPQLQDYTIAQALANYTPVFGGGVNYNNQQQPPSSFLSGSDTTVTSSNFGGNAQIAKFFPWGTNAVVSWDSSRSTTNNTFSSFDPQLNGNVNVQVTQPFLRNFKFDTVREQVFAAHKNREIADVDLQQSVALTTRQVKVAYWNYVFALDSLVVSQQSLDLAQE